MNQQPKSIWQWTTGQELGLGFVLGDTSDYYVVNMRIMVIGSSNNPDLVPVNPELLAAVSVQLRAAHTEQ